MPDHAPAMAPLSDQMKESYHASMVANWEKQLLSDEEKSSTQPNFSNITTLRDRSSDPRQSIKDWAFFSLLRLLIRLYEEKKRKPLSESSEAPPLAKRAKAGKVVKKRTVKSSKQMVDEFVDEGVHAAKPSLEDTEGGDTAKEVPGKGNRSDTDLMNEMPSVVRSGALEKPGWTKPLIDVAES
ncbi:hypothetical protein Tco_1571264 [Tanacetum coccineum]